MEETKAAGGAPKGGALLKVRRLRKSYGGVRALYEVSLGVQAGKIRALVGDNGAGKSTLIKAIFGALRPGAGEILVSGATVELRSPRDATALGTETVHQSLGPVHALNVPQNVFLGRKLRRGVLGIFRQLDHAEMRWRTRALLERFNIGMPTLHEPVLRLSGGQHQTVAISRLMLGEPRLLIMDEPIAALGVDEGRKVLDPVATLRERGMAILMISHNLEHVCAIADRIAVMRTGRMVALRSTAEVSREDVVGMIAQGSLWLSREQRHAA